jgi:hypothetical protein
VGKRVVWGATPEQEKLKAKKLSDEAHAGEKPTKPIADSK